VVPTDLADESARPAIGAGIASASGMQAAAAINVDLMMDLASRSA
jgi:hypothetical protein